MNTAIKALGWTLVLSAMAALVGPRPAAAEEPPASATPVAQPEHTTAQAEAGEPRADTSAAPATDAPAAGARAAGGPTPAARTPPTPASARAAGSAAKSTATDRLELGTATVTGDREQPKVMYIVPWKKSDIGDLSGKPMNSLLDEALAPVDRDEFKREVIYYQAVKADASQNGASRLPAKQGEK
jgi:hypothetical protein